MARIAAAALVAAFSLPAFARGASADGAAGAARCGPTATIERVLAQDYGERMVASGITGAGNQYRIYAAPKGETWSAVVAMPDGFACLLGAGRDWQILVPPGDPA